MNDELLAKEMLRGLEEADRAEPTTPGKKRQSYAPLFDNIAAWLLMAVAFLLPLMYFPSDSVPLNLAKKVTLVLGVFLALLAWLAARLEDCTFVVPKSLILLGGGAVAIITVVSSLASGMSGLTFWGVWTETGTAGSVITFSLLLFLSSIYFQSKKRLLTIAKLFFTAFFIMIALELLRLFPSFDGLVPIFGQGTTIFGLLPNVTDNLLGKWNDMGTFFAFGVVVCMAMLDLFHRDSPRPLMYIGVVLGLLITFIVNFNLSWFVLGIVSLILLLYKLAIGKMLRASGAPALIISLIVYLIFLATLMPWLLETGKSAYLIGALVVVLAGVVIYSASKLGIASWVSVYIFLVATLCYSLYMPIGGYLRESGINSLEVRPAWGATLSVVGQALEKRPLLGTGPNTFSRLWLSHKPAGVNETVFWNTEFNSAVGYTPTFIATTGVLGLLAWLLLLGSYLTLGIKALFKLAGDHVTHNVLSASFISSLFLWLMATLYVPDTVMLALAFMLTGLFIGGLVTTKISKEYTLSFLNNPRLSFAVIIGIVISMLLALSFLFISVRKYVAFARFQSAVIESNTTGKLEVAADRLKAAISLDSNDLYYRSLADLRVAQISRLLNTQDASEEELVRGVQSALQDGLASAARAVEISPNTYENHMSFARVYEAVVPLKTGDMEDWYTRAKAEYEAALTLNPTSPLIYLTMARLELARGEKQAAREMIAKSLEQKSNYAAAIFLLSQIEADAGNLQAAIENAERASQFAPEDIGVYFQIGLLKYLNKDYEGAGVALERAVFINPSYSNAKYFLGLSYDRLGFDEEAIGQFEDLEVSNPENLEVKSILKNLRAGLNPFTNTESGAPEDREDPPVEE